MSYITKRAVIIIFNCFIIGLSNSAFVDTLTKCGIKDNDCQKQLFLDTLHKIAETGIPEMQIPPIDPFRLQNVTVSIFNLFNLTLVDGVAIGVKNCLFGKYETDIEKGIGSQEITCDITVKGHYLLDAASQLVEGVLGGSEIHGEGNGILKIEKLQLELKFPFYAEKLDDGEIYLRCDYKKVDQKFDILGRVSFDADNIFLGKQDVSEVVVGYLNDNWKFIIKSFGQTFLDKASEYYFSLIGDFFDAVPARYYITEDLGQYLRD